MMVHLFVKLLQIGQALVTDVSGTVFRAFLWQGVDFQYDQLGKAIPPPKDRQPSGGNYKEMPEGVRPMPAEDQNPEAQQYVNELMERASQSAEDQEEEEEEY